MINPTLIPIILLMKHLDRCKFLLLGHATSPPNGVDNIVEFSERVQLPFVGQNLQELDLETIGPDCRSVRQRADRLSCTSYLNGTSSSGRHGLTA